MATAASRSARHPRAPTPTGILVDNQIRAARAAKEIEIDPFSDECLEPATYDLRLGSLAAVSTSSKPLDLKEHELLAIEPGAMAIVQTLEVVGLSKDLAARPGPKTDLLRRGVFVSAGPQIDPGFRGRLIVNLINLSPRTFSLRYREPFLSVEFHRLAGRPSRTYAGPKQGRMELQREELDILLAYQGPTLAEIYRGYAELKDNLRDAAQWHTESREMVGLLKELVQERRTAPRPLATARVEITSLAPEPYKLLRPITVHLQVEGDEFMASFLDANIHASGETDQAAFDNLRSQILDVLESLQRDRRSLDPETSRQLAVLESFISRSE